jgi:hypothetical protein
MVPFLVRSTAYAPIKGNMHTCFIPLYVYRHVLDQLNVATCTHNVHAHASHHTHTHTRDNTKAAHSVWRGLSREASNSQTVQPFEYFLLGGGRVRWAGGASTRHVACVWVCGLRSWCEAFVCVVGPSSMMLRLRPFAVAHRAIPLGTPRILTRQARTRPISTVSRRARSLYEGYDGLLQRYRLATTTVTGAVLAFAGDACTQTATSADGLDGYDLNRGVSFAFFGATVTGPVNFLWLSRLDSLVTRLAPQAGWLAIGTKVTIQTFFFQPFVYVPLFFGFSAALRGWSFETAQERVRQEYTRTVVSLWSFWTPIVVFTFAVLPVRQQAIFFSGVSLVWNAVLSFLSNQIPSRTSAEVEEPPSSSSQPVPESGEKRLRRSPSGRFLPSHQPPMGILDNDPQELRNRGPTDQSVIGFLLGPGLM